MDPKFTIETNGVEFVRLPTNTLTPDFLGADAQHERGAAIVSLDKALELSVRHNRGYQERKERLYLEALDLTLARYFFAPIFSGGSSADYTGTEADHAATVSPSFGADWVIRDIGKISAAFLTDFTWFLNGDPQLVTSSQLSATFTRPLLRNAGFKAETEALTQAERDVLYELRDFVQFRRTFSVEVATAYYQVLGNRDTIRNSWLNLESSRRAAERSRALAQEGRATQSDLGRLEQQVLSAEASWISAMRNYSRALDNFKIRLGVPLETALVLEDRELVKLQIETPKVDPNDAIRIALKERLDLHNVRDRREDARRKSLLAADRLKPQLDLIAGASMDRAAGNRVLPDPSRYRYNVGLDLDLPLNRKAERNSYRAALITEERAARDLSLRQDEIQLEVRESYRTLEQARRTYEISEVGVRLAERRVEEQELLAQLGRAKAQDQVDAQNDLANSKNQRTQALVAHTIARLQFWVNLGILYIKENGQWREMNNVKP